MITSLNAIDTQKTIAEHTAIILNYKNTGFLDKVNAIKKYKDFNIIHPDYYATISSASLVSSQLINIEDASTEVIIRNIYSQLLWLTGEEYLKTMEIEL